MPGERGDKGSKGIAGTKGERGAEGPPGPVSTSVDGSSMSKVIMGGMCVDVDFVDRYEMISLDNILAFSIRFN